MLKGRSYAVFMKYAYLSYMPMYLHVTLQILRIVKLLPRSKNTCKRQHDVNGKC
jgi:hypothetical protein